MAEALERLFEYHQATKHHPNAYARGPGMLDWANEPDPFRRYIGAPTVALDREGIGKPGAGPASLNIHSISRLFFCSLALSAWKRSGGATWSLRVNPSSGDLHPTECYLISGRIEGLKDSPGVFHYTPKEHALELRSSLKSEEWNAFGMPEGSFLIALSSIYWREAWKYGERALRYCMTDTGHALAAVSIAAACMGWQSALLDDPGTDDLAGLLGLPGYGPEAEHAECLVIVFTDGLMHDVSLQMDRLANLSLSHQGRPNALSPEHVEWPIIDTASAAVKKPATRSGIAGGGRLPSDDFCRVLRRRRSAQAMDARTHISRDRFYTILEMAMPGRVPFNILPWRPFVHPALFVHRVHDIEEGLYLLVRDALQVHRLKETMSDDFAWKRPEGCPDDLGLYFLAQGDTRMAARQSSCSQDIASDGCFAAAMIAEFERPLREIGPWFYPRLHWECGMIGQNLYLGAEVFGLRGCGMGCYLDDIVHEMLGLEGTEYQDLYHFAFGRAVEDPRLTTLPAYGQ